MQEKSTLVTKTLFCCKPNAMYKAYQYLPVSLLLMLSSHMVLVLLWLIPGASGCEVSSCVRPIRCWSTRVPGSHPPRHQCPDNDLCRCSNTTLDCSSHHGDLPYVPHVEGSFQILNFSNNDLRRISSTDFFANVSNTVRVVDLYKNNLVHIVPGVFDRLSKLKWVQLGGNRLSFKDVFAVNLPATVYSLDFQCMGYQEVAPPHKGVNFSRSCVGYINMDLNSLESLDLSAFNVTPKLSYLFLRANKLYNLTTALMPNLWKINLGKNRLFDFPRTCTNTNDSLFPELVNLTLDFNMISCIGHVCLPKVRRLELTYNFFQYIMSDTFSAKKFPSLKELHLAQMRIQVRKIAKYAFNHSVLERLVLAKNALDFASPVVDRDAFAGCTGLLNLQLGSSNFESVSKAIFSRLFGSLTKLKNLDITDSRVGVIYSETFASFTGLTSLYLYRNALTYIPDGAFDRMQNLTHLDVGFNRIQTISQFTFGKMAAKRFKILNLGGNPFQCNCDILWFKKWLESSLHIFDRRYHYVCANLPNVTLQDYVLNEQACLLGSDAASFTIAVTCVLLSFLLLFVIIFRFRWRMRLWLYEACRASRQDRRRQMVAEGRRYRFDVFVAYAAEDLAWVQRELLPVLEGEWGLRLCVHQRDFEAGKHIVDNISDCVSDSERVLLVFSPHFAHSEWCQFELKYCQVNVMERDDVMVLVELRETPSRDMTGAMLAVLQTTTYIEWEDGQDARQSFWARLRLALDE
ncbi:toll-like receptor 13 [Littorina saxatilis]|uniref:toll-like receptor 13 n=1 Tax=Littorina saxatilis TaxID=31220 RepID=UPI0038B649BA